MNMHTKPEAGATLQDVLDGLDANPSLSPTRRRDLRSAVNCFAALTDNRPSLIPLELAAIRAVLDLMVPIQARVSRKRWANLRSDLAAAIAGSGLLPMVKTASVEMSETWLALFDKARAPYLRHGLSRFARWASERQIGPTDVTKAVLDQFIAELLEGTLVRKIITLRQNIVRSWNALIGCLPNEGLQPIAVTKIRHGPPRFPWSELPSSFRDDVDQYLKWASVPDPLDENARGTALKKGTLALRKDHVHSAVTAAIAAGVSSGDLVNLSSLVEIDMFKKILRYQWEAEGRTLSAYTHGVAGSLVAIAAEWAKVPDVQLQTLKATRRKLGQIKFGLTDKNKNFLRKFDDARLLARLLNLPDKLWRRTASDLKTSRRGFVELQAALAIEILLVAPLRMGNLSVLCFDKHLRWPHGYEKPAWIVIGESETKNGIALEFELPQPLSDRIATYRSEMVPNITGIRATHLFVTWTGKRRSQAAVALSIEKTVLKYVGVRLTPHQFRHLAAKLLLDGSPGAYPLVQQLMGHKNMQTTINFYAGIDTRRAGRKHAELISRLKKEL